MDYLAYYDLESYLLDTVRQRFRTQGSLGAFDFFSIVIWKANRAKSRIARRLLERGFDTLDAATIALTVGIARLSTPKERLHYLLNDWGFRLPMASAILSILYPDEFTVYDNRLCEQFGAFANLATLSSFDDVWNGYEQFRARVRASAPDGLSLRDKDRYLWGKSASEQLTRDVAAGFGQQGAGSEG